MKTLKFSATKYASSESLEINLHMKKNSAIVVIFFPFFP